jgi:hypothetical protein
VRPLRDLCPGLPQGLLNLVHRAMQPERSARFESALEMRRALSAFAGELSAAGRVAASVALGPRPPQVPGGPAGTEKVAAILPAAMVPAALGVAPASAVRPLAAEGGPARVDGVTGEMSQFRGLPARAVADGSAAGEASHDAAHPRAAALGAGSDAAASPIGLAPFGDRHIARTAEMPEQPRRVAPTLPTPDLPPPLDRATRRSLARRMLLAFLCLGALAGAGIGVFWLLVETGVVQLYSNPGPPPPMPQPQGVKRPSSSRPAEKP